MFGQEWATLIAASLTAILGVARLTRLIAEDDWPPADWFRNKWITAFNTSPWAGLVLCPFCVAPYIAAASLAWAIATDLQPAWWIIHGWLALAYLAAITVARDLPADARE